MQRFSLILANIDQPEAIMRAVPQFQQARFIGKYLVKTTPITRKASIC